MLVVVPSHMGWERVAAHVFSPFPPQRWCINVHVLRRSSSSYEQGTDSPQKRTLPHSSPTAPLPPPPPNHSFVTLTYEGGNPVEVTVTNTDEDKISHKSLREQSRVSSDSFTVCFFLNFVEFHSGLGHAGAVEGLSLHSPSGTPHLRPPSNSATCTCAVGRGGKRASGERKRNVVSRRQQKRGGRGSLESTGP